MLIYAPFAYENNEVRTRLGEVPITMKMKAELVFVPSFGISHLNPTVEFAKRLTSRCDCFSATILIIPGHISATTPVDESSESGTKTIRFIHLPPPEVPLPPDVQPGIPFFSLLIDSYKPQVEHTINQLLTNSEPIVGLFVDMFTTTMIDVADHLGIPSYLYYVSGAAVLGFMLHFPTLHDENQIQDHILRRESLLIPSFVNSVPTLALPSVMFDTNSQTYKLLLYHARNFRKVKGIIVNSVSELEPKAMETFSNHHHHPKVYPVGPILDLNRRPKKPGHHEKIIAWLDNQPPASVVFLCFGSGGAFTAQQVKEIAGGLERSGHRFLWSLRRPPAGKLELPSDYTNLEEVLPRGFLERTAERGLVCGWAPQVEVLAHEATGGFVSHCGWNSTLESVWFGIPILTWPLYAEQKMNAFEIVTELGLGVEMRRGDCYKDNEGIFRNAEEIESGIRCLVESDSEVRKRVKEMGDKCRKAVMVGGSSFRSIGCLIQDLIGE